MSGEAKRDPVIEMRDLVKLYGGAEAVAGLDLTVNEGEVFGLLGPNGSGKTTMILILLGLTDPTSRTVRVTGLDPLRQPLAVKRAVGYLPDDVGFYDTMTARENLRYTARLAGLDTAEADRRIDNALERVRLHDVAEKAVAGFSHGMRQRLGLTEVLVKDCPIAILDEPTNGLDPQSTTELLGLIRKLRDDGRTVLLSSHMLSLVQSICDRVTLINHGRIGLTGPVDTLRSQVLGGAYTIEVEADGVDIGKVTVDIPGATGVETPRRGHAYIRTHADIRTDVAAKIVQDSERLSSIAMHRPNLNDVYQRYFEDMSHAA
ncbi:MAG: ABC transporter ATP-binding protein [Breoghania sp.]|nr:ABC transporter ATP-binding protein [Breoghania sp.]MDJ0931944.1 ABC transporter ATP-binding protein [Breoghania sp.]